MSRNWIRACSLQVSGSQSSKDLGSLRVVFNIEQWHLQAPNMAYFRVYNPSPDTRSQFQNKEFTKVTFTAGYQDNQGVIFQGDIKQSIWGHETAVDTYIDIYAADSERGYNAARVTKTLKSGYTPQDRLQVAVDAFKQFDVTLGSIKGLDLSTPKYPRGLPMIGMARDVLRSVVLSKGGLWSIQNGKIMVTSKNLDSDGGVITLDAKTGLIGWPQQTQDGIKVTSLLNPALTPLKQIKLDPSSIIAAARDNNPLSQTAPQTNMNLDQQGLGAGTYTIFHMRRMGDSRGREWYDESLCIGKGGNLPSGQAQQGYTLGQS